MNKPSMLFPSQGRRLIAALCLLSLLFSLLPAWTVSAYAASASEDYASARDGLAARYQSEAVGELYDQIYAALNGVHTSRDKTGYVIYSRPNYYVGVGNGTKRFELDRSGVSSLDGEPGRDALKAVLRDHPEFFWLDESASLKNTLKTGNGYLQIASSYVSGSGSQRKLSDNCFETITMLASLTAGVTEPSDFEKASSAETQLKSKLTPSVSGAVKLDAVLGTGATPISASSEGYAKAFVYILHEKGLDCILVSDAEGRFWNMAKLDGAWYAFDVYRDDALGETTGSTSLAWFCVPETVYFTAEHIDDGFLVLPRAAQSEHSANNAGLLLPGSEEVVVRDGLRYKVVAPRLLELIGPASGSGIAERTSWTAPAAYTDREYRYGLGSIGAGAFSGASALAAIDLTGAVCLTHIGAGAFAGTALTEIALTDSVTSLDPGALQCATLRLISVGENNQAFSSSNGVLYSKDGKELICYPVGKSGSGFTVPSNVQKVADKAFAGSALKTLRFGGNMPTIAGNAFADCSEELYLLIDGRAENSWKNNYNYTSCTLRSPNIPAFFTFVSSETPVSFQKDAVDLVDKNGQMSYSAKTGKWTAKVANTRAEITDVSIPNDADMEFAITVSGTGSVRFLDNGVRWLRFGILEDGQAVLYSGDQLVRSAALPDDLKAGDSLRVTVEGNIVRCSLEDVQIFRFELKDLNSTREDYGTGISLCAQKRGDSFSNPGLCIFGKNAIAFQDESGSPVAVGAKGITLNNEGFAIATSQLYDGASDFTFKAELTDGIGLVYAVNKAPGEGFAEDLHYYWLYLSQGWLNLARYDDDQTTIKSVQVSGDANKCSVKLERFTDAFGKTVQTVYLNNDNQAAFSYEEPERLTGTGYGLKGRGSASSFFVQFNNDYSELHEEGEYTVNRQGIRFTLRDDGTALVGVGDSNNNSGYDEANYGLVEIPETVRKDGVSYKVTGVNTNAFAENSKLLGITLPASIRSIGVGAFYGCDQLEGVTMKGEAPESVGTGAFAGCPALTAVSVKSFYADSYGVSYENPYWEAGDCIAIAADDAYYSDWIVLDENGSNGKGVSFDCSGDRATLNSYPDYALSDGEATIPQVVAYQGKVYPVVVIGSNAFAASRVVSVALPDTVTEIANGAFGNCKQLQTVTLSDALTVIGEGAFANDTALTSIALPESLAEIKKSAFQSTGLTEIRFPASLSQLGDNAFADCEALTSAIFDGNKPVFGKDVFGLRSDSGYDGENGTVILYYQQDKTGWSYPYTKRDPGDPDCEKYLSTALGDTLSGKNGVVIKYCRLETGNEDIWDNQSGSYFAIKTKTASSAAIISNTVPGEDSMFLFEADVNGSGNSSSKMPYGLLLSIDGDSFATSNGTAYLFGFTTEGYVVLRKYDRGTLVQPAEGQRFPAYNEGRTYHLSVRYEPIAEGVKLRCSINDVLFFEYTDETPLAAGRCGFLSAENGSVNFDPSQTMCFSNVSLTEIAVDSNKTVLEFVNLSGGALSVTGQAELMPASGASETEPLVAQIENYSYNGQSTFSLSAAVHGTVDGANGIFFGASEQGDGSFSAYLLTADRYTDEAGQSREGVVLYKVTGGMTQLEKLAAFTPSGFSMDACTLRVDWNAAKEINCYVDGQWAFRYYDNAYLSGRSFGLYAAENVAFSDVILTVNGNLSSEGVTAYSQLNSEKRNVQGVVFTLDENAKTALVGAASADGSYAHGNALSADSGATSVELPSVVTYNSVEYQVTGIAPYAFADAEELGAVTIPDTVLTIGEGAFSGCTGLRSIELPYSLERLEKKTFSDCSGLIGVSMKAKLAVIGEEAFSGCSAMVSVTIPSSVESISDTAFLNCRQLNSFTVVGGNLCFSTANGILYDVERTTLLRYPEGKAASRFTVPSSVLRIADHAFDGAKFSSIELDNTLQSIGNYAFSGNENLRGVTLPASLIELGENAFLGCVSLAGIAVEDGNESFRVTDGILCSADGMIYCLMPAALGDECCFVPDGVSFLTGCFADYTGTVIVANAAQVAELAVQEVDCILLGDLSLRPELEITLPYREEYVSDGTIPYDYDGLTVTAVYADEANKEYRRPLKMDDGFTVEAPAMPTENASGNVTIRMKDGDASAQYPIWFADKVPEALRIDSLPDKTEYVKNDELDLTGLAVTLVYSDGSEEALEADMYEAEGFISDISVATVQEDITLLWTGAHTKLKTSFTVKVVDEQVSEVVVSGWDPGINAQKIVYGGNLDLTGLTVFLRYNTGSIKYLTYGEDADYWIVGFDNTDLSRGQQKLTLTFADELNVPLELIPRMVSVQLQQITPNLSGKTPVKSAQGKDSITISVKPADADYTTEKGFGGYVFYIKESGGAWDEGHASGTSYTFTDLKDNTAYSFRYSVNQAQEAHGHNIFNLLANNAGYYSGEISYYTSKLDIEDSPAAPVLLGGWKDNGDARISGVIALPISEDYPTDHYSYKLSTDERKWTECDHVYGKDGEGRIIEWHLSEYLTLADTGSLEDPYYEDFTWYVGREYSELNGNTEYRFCARYTASDRNDGPISSYYSSATIKYTPSTGDVNAYSVGVASVSISFTDGYEYQFTALPGEDGRGDFSGAVTYGSADASNGVISIYELEPYTTYYVRGHRLATSSTNETDWRYTKVTTSKAALDAPPANPIPCDKNQYAEEYDVAYNDYECTASVKFIPERTATRLVCRRSTSNSYSEYFLPVSGFVSCSGHWYCLYFGTEIDASSYFGGDVGFVRNDQTDAILQETGLDKLCTTSPWVLCEFDAVPEKLTLTIKGLSPVTNYSLRFYYAATTEKTASPVAEDVVYIMTVKLSQPPVGRTLTRKESSGTTVTLEIKELEEGESEDWALLYCMDHPENDDAWQESNVFTNLEPGMHRFYVCFAPTTRAIRGEYNEDDALVVKIPEPIDKLLSYTDLELIENKIAVAGDCYYGGTVYVTISENEALRYQWLRDGTPISGATGRSYTITYADMPRTYALMEDGKLTDEYAYTAPRISVRITAVDPARYEGSYTMNAGIPGKSPSGDFNELDTWERNSRSDLGIREYSVYASVFEPMYVTVDEDGQSDISKASVSIPRWTEAMVFDDASYDPVTDAEHQITARSGLTAGDYYIWYRWSENELYEASAWAGPELVHLTDPSFDAEFTIRNLSGSAADPTVLDTFTVDVDESSSNSSEYEVHWRIVRTYKYSLRYEYNDVDPETGKSEWLHYDDPTQYTGLAYPVINYSTRTGLYYQPDKQYDYIDSQTFSKYNDDPDDPSHTTFPIAFSKLNSENAAAKDGSTTVECTCTETRYYSYHLEARLESTGSEARGATGYREYPYTLRKATPTLAAVDEDQVEVTHTTVTFPRVSTPVYAAYLQGTAPSGAVWHDPVDGALKLYALSADRNELHTLRITTEDACEVDAAGNVVTILNSTSNAGNRLRLADNAACWAKLDDAGRILVSTDENHQNYRLLAENEEELYYSPEPNGTLRFAVAWKYNGAESTAAMFMEYSYTDELGRDWYRTRHFTPVETDGGDLLAVGITPGKKVKLYTTIDSTNVCYPASTETDVDSCFVNMKKIGVETPDPSLVSAVRSAGANYIQMDVTELRGDKLTYLFEDGENSGTSGMADAISETKKVVYSIDGKNWSNSGRLSGLQPNTEYTVYYKTAEGEGVTESEPGAIEHVRSGKAENVQPPADLPQLVDHGTDVDEVASWVSIRSKMDCDYTVLGTGEKMEDAEWVPGDGDVLRFDGLKPGSVYHIYARMSETEETAASAAGNGLEVTTDKLETATKPNQNNYSKDTLFNQANISYNSLKISGVAPALYMIKDEYGDSRTLEISINGKWYKLGAETTVTGLSVNTVYNVSIRLSESDKSLAGEAVELPYTVQTKRAPQEAPDTEPSALLITAGSLTLMDMSTATQRYEYYAAETVNGSTDPLDYSFDEDLWQSATVFSGLTQDADYTFFMRKAGTSYYLPSAAGPGKTYTIGSWALKGSVSIDAVEGGAYCYGAKLKANIEALNYRNTDNMQCEWRVDGVAVAGAPTSLTVPFAINRSEYIGREVTVAVSIVSPPSSDPFESEPVRITKARYAGVPEINIVSTENASITVACTGSTSVQYSMDGTNYVGTGSNRWTFYDLNPGENNTVYARFAETETMFASAASSIAVTVGLIAADPIDPPTVVTFNDTSITVNVLAGCEYELQSVEGTETGAIEADGTYTFTNLYPGKTYTVRGRRLGDGVRTGPSAWSSQSVTLPKGSQQSPTLTQNDVEAKANSITMKTVGMPYEYRLRRSGGNWSAWQTNPTFSNLVANTDYEVQARRKATEYLNASDPSNAVEVTTPKAAGAEIDFEPHFTATDTEIRWTGQTSQLVGLEYRFNEAEEWTKITAYPSGGILLGSELKPDTPYSIVIRRSETQTTAAGPESVFEIRTLRQFVWTYHLTIRDGDDIVSDQVTVSFYDGQLSGEKQSEINAIKRHWTKDEQYVYICTSFPEVASISVHQDDDISVEFQRTLRPYTVELINAETQDAIGEPITGYMNGESLAITRPENYQTEAYDFTFTGWQYVKKDGSQGKIGKDETELDLKELDITVLDRDVVRILATFSRTLRSYTVNYLLESGTEITSQTFHYGDSLTEPENLRTGTVVSDVADLEAFELPLKGTAENHHAYTLKKWTLADGTQKPLTVNRDLVLKAVFEMDAHVSADAVRENEVLPTCTETGSHDEVVYCAVCGDELSRTKVTDPALGHDWGAAGYTWSADNSTVTAQRVCSRDASHVHTEVSHTTCNVTKPADCETSGETVYTAVFTDAAYKTQTKTVTVPALGHDYHGVVTAPTCTNGGYTTYTCSRCKDSYTANYTEALGHSWSQPSYEWNADYSAVTARRTCTRCEYVESENVKTSASIKEPTCLEAGEIVYTVSFTNPAFAAQTKKEAYGNALGHDYKSVVTEPTCTEGGYTTYICSRCQDSYTSDSTEAPGHDYHSVVTAPTCTEGGYTTYTCSRCQDSYKADYTDELGHEWGEPTYDWAAHYSSVTAKRVCAHDARHIETETVQTTSEVTLEATPANDGEITYTAVFASEVFQTQTKTQSIPALGFEWSTPEYTWADDFSSVTATRKCTNDTSVDDQTETVTTIKETVAATCEEAGSITYTASFSSTAFETQVKTVTITALGHDWGTPAYEWSADNRQITATRVCSHDQSHVETETVNTTSEVSTPATCLTRGKTTYTASFSNPAFQTQTKTAEDIPALGHAWGTVEYTWSADKKLVAATRVCSHDQRHMETETVNTISAITTQADCEEDGVRTYTASFSNAAFQTRQKTEVIPALGHDWGDWEFEWDMDGSVKAERVCAHDKNHVETKTADTFAESVQFVRELLGDDLEHLYIAAYRTTGRMIAFIDCGGANPNYARLQNAAKLKIFYLGENLKPLRDNDFAEDKTNALLHQSGSPRGR